MWSKHGFGRGDVTYKFEAFVYMYKFTFVGCTGRQEESSEDWCIQRTLGCCGNAGKKQHI